MAPACCRPGCCSTEQEQVPSKTACNGKACSPSVTESKNIVDVVTDAYSAKAREHVDPSYANKVAAAFGYTAEQLNAVPDGAHMGLSCGNPIVTATIKEGETVVDLGSGGGVDIFLAAEKVGPTGQAIGLDNSLDMVALARKNAAKKGLKPPNVAFVQASLAESLPLESDSVDCILSNCVINLLPLEGKSRIFKEMHRILKKGGRVVLDDIIAKKPLPSSIKDNVLATVSCLGSAVTAEEYKGFLAEAGFNDVNIVDNKHDLNVYLSADDENMASKTACCILAPAIKDDLSSDYDANELAASCAIYAVKTNDSKTDSSESVPSKLALSRWWDAYPVAKSTSFPEVTVEEVAKLIRDSEGKGTDFAVIDVRRADHAGGHVRGSYNFHAQTFYDDLPSFYEKFKNTEKVIFYCTSSKGRAPRSAGWYQDYLDARAGENHGSKAYLLQGGIKQFLQEFEGNGDLIDQD